MSRSLRGPLRHVYLFVGLRGCRFRAVIGLLLGQLALLVPPAPVADECAFGVLADGRLLAVFVPPNPVAFGQIVFVLARGRNLAVLVPEGERAGFLTHSYNPSSSGLPLAYHDFDEPCRMSLPSLPYFAKRTAQKSSGAVSTVLAARYIDFRFFFPRAGVVVRLGDDLAAFFERCRPGNLAGLLVDFQKVANGHRILVGRLLEISCRSATRWWPWPLRSPALNEMISTLRSFASVMTQSPSILPSLNVACDMNGALKCLNGNSLNVGESLWPFQRVHIPLRSPKVVLTFGDHIATRAIHLPRAVVHVIAVAVERDLAFDSHFPVSVALADELDLASYTRLGLNFRIVGCGDIAEQRNGKVAGTRNLLCSSARAAEFNPIAIAIATQPDAS